MTSATPDTAKTPEPSGPRRRASSAATRARLIEAATELFTEQGFNLRLQEVARRAGVTTGAIYSNFPDKLSLLGAVLQQAGEEELGALATRGDSKRRAIDMIKGRLGRRLVRPPKEGVFLLIEAMVSSRRDPDVKQSMQAALSRRHEELTRLVERAAEDGDLATDVPAAALARLIQATTLGSALLAATGTPAPPEEQWAELTRRIIAGLKRSGPSDG